jgi:hypothetical protein
VVFLLGLAGYPHIWMDYSFDGFVLLNMAHMAHMAQYKSNWSKWIYMALCGQYVLM